MRQRQTFLTLRLPAALLLCLWGLAGAAARAATLYSSNFDSATLGTAPTGWVNGAGAWIVGTTSPVSSPNTFSASANGATAVYTGVAAQANECIQFDQVAVVGGGTGVSSQVSPCLRSNSAGTSLYECSYNLQTHSAQWYAVAPGLGGGAGYVAVGSSFTIPTYANGAPYTVKEDVSGSVLSVKFWAQGTTEPGSWTNQVTDSGNSITGTGYAALFANTNMTPLPAVDNLFIGDAGTTFALPVSAGAAGVTGLTGSSLTLAWTAATGGTAPYTYSLYRSTAQGTQGSLVASGVTSPYTNPGLTAGTTYGYTVVAADAASATAAYPQTFGTPSPARLLVVDGNSLAAGLDNQDGATLAQQLRSRLGLGWTVTDVAVSGTNIQDAIARYPSTVAPLYSAATYPGGCYICFWELSNQITAGSGPTATLGYLQSYVALAHATGFRVAVGDVISRHQPTMYGQFETDRGAANAALRATWGTAVRADGFADIAADSRFGPWGASASGTYFYQGAGNDQQVHLTSYAVPADYFAAAVCQAASPSLSRPRGSRPAPKGGH